MDSALSISFRYSLADIKLRPGTLLNRRDWLLGRGLGRAHESAPCSCPEFPAEVSPIGSLQSFAATLSVGTDFSRCLRMEIKASRGSCHLQNSRASMTAGECSTCTVFFCGLAWNIHAWKWSTPASREVTVAPRDTYRYVLRDGHRMSIGRTRAVLPFPLTSTGGSEMTDD